MITTAKEAGEDVDEFHEVDSFDLRGVTNTWNFAETADTSFLR
jgi:hypothetical protein